MQFQTTILRNILYGAVSHGADFHELCKRSGLTPVDLTDTEKLIDWEKAPYLWDHAVRMTNDELLGLHLGEESNPSFLGTLGYLMQNCPTLGDALTAFSQYNDTFSSVFKYSFGESEDKDSFCICYDPSLLYRNKYPESARQAVDMSMSGTLKLLSTLSGKKIYPVKAEFTYGKRNLSEYERVFRSKVIFDADQNRLIFEKEVFDIPVISYDKSLYSLFGAILKQKQKSLQVQKSFSEEVRQILILKFKGFTPPIDIVASELCVSTRTFQRNLSHENTSYREICNSLKRELATTLLENKASKLADVATLLGYADLSAFRRAFKSWTNNPT